MILNKKFYFAFVLFFSFTSFINADYEFEPGTDDPAAFHSCFYLGNIVDDEQKTETTDIDVNELTFHDGRAIQLYSMNQLSGNGHTNSYIKKHENKIADLARENSNISEYGGKADWYDGRVVALAGLLWCSDDNPLNESNFFPRFNCNNPISSVSENLFPNGEVIERIKKYSRPCCVTSGSSNDPSEEVKIFPCQLQDR